MKTLYLAYNTSSVEKLIIDDTEIAAINSAIEVSRELGNRVETYLKFVESDMDIFHYDGVLGRIAVDRGSGEIGISIGYNHSGSGRMIFGSRTLSFPNMGAMPDVFFSASFLDRVLIPDSSSLYQEQTTKKVLSVVDREHEHPFLDALIKRAGLILEDPAAVRLNKYIAYHIEMGRETAIARVQKIACLARTVLDSKEESAGFRVQLLDRFLLPDDPTLQDLKRR